MERPPYAIDLYASACGTAVFLAMLEVYGLIRLRQMAHLVIVQKRYPQLIRIEAIALIIFSFVTIPLWGNWLLDAVHVTTVASDRRTFRHYNFLAFLPFFQPITHFVMQIEALRLWLMYYNLQCLRCSKHSAWKSQINSSESEANSWYIR